jgi:outer membrane protein OmpA-like peptidoglycan-associated protein
MTLQTGRAHVALTALSRTSDRAVTGQFTISNDSPGELDLAVALFETGRDNDYETANGIGLLDGTGNKLYMPLRTADGRCLCSDLSATVIPPGGAADVFAVFPAPPASVRRVSVLMPHTVPLQDVPITTGPVRPLPGQDIDPGATPLAPPRILAVTATVAGSDESTADNGGDRAIRLSSDVLFAVNKADLTARASALLATVAKQISESTATTVRVDGYTDTTGNDAINQPLSQRRAQAVARRLQDLVTRHGVTFQVAGHGSRDPVAPNTTDQGRRENRRTTITFTRPLPGPAAQPAPGGAPYQWATGKSPVLGRAAFAPPEASGLTIEVNSLHRDASGVTTLVWTLRNNSHGPTDIGSRFDAFDYFANPGNLTTVNVNSTLGLALVDTARTLRYQPLQASDTRCLCTEFIRADAKSRIAPGDTATYSNVYELPPDLQTVDLRVPWSSSPGATVKGLIVR